MSEKTIPTELIKAGAQIAATLLGELLDTWMSGGDIEPIVSRLPPETQKVARREMEDAAMLQRLQDIRAKYGLPD